MYGIDLVVQPRGKWKNKRKSLKRLRKSLTPPKMKKKKLTMKEKCLNTTTKECQILRSVRGEKEQYSKRQKKRRQSTIIHTIKMAMSDLTQEGSFKPVQFKLLNEYDEEIVVDFEETDNSPLEDDSDGKNTMLDSEDLDEVVFILDNHNVANRGYHALAKIHHFLPRAHQINKRRKQLNSMIEIKEVDGEYLGAYTSLTAMIIRKLENEHNPNLIQDGKVRIKLSGDGTRITCKQNFVNMAITFPDEEQCMSEHGNYLLAIVKCPEKNVSLNAAIHNLIDKRSLKIFR